MFAAEEHVSHSNATIVGLLGFARNDGVGRLTISQNSLVS
jgi:hypothetical protein